MGNGKGVSHLPSASGGIGIVDNSRANAVDCPFHLDLTYCNYNQPTLKKSEKNEIFAAPGRRSD
jgi:hypothetical protein